MHSSISVLSEARIVRDHANGRASGVQFLQQIHHRFAVPRIEVTRWLVRQQDCRFPGKRPRYRYTLLLAA